MRNLEFGARFLPEPGNSANETLEMKILLGFREVVERMRRLPREERLKVHPDWWYFQESYCFRTRKMEDQMLLDPRRMM